MLCRNCLVFKELFIKFCELNWKIKNYLCQNPQTVTGITLLLVFGCSRISLNSVIFLSHNAAVSSARHFLP
jgi:hypothetical protein